MAPTQPVKGCNGCRKLKVKCDRTTPACSRCVKSSRECIYPDEFDAAHRDQRVVAKASAEKKWRQRVGNPSASTAQPVMDGEAISEHRSDTPHVGLRDSLHQLAYQRFRYDFVMPSGVNSPARGTFSRLDSLYPEASEDSCLYCAVTAVSCANFNGRVKSEEAKHAGVVYYGKTLQKLAALMAMDPANVNSDEILVVILVLGLYETLTSAHRDGFWVTHMRGTQSVIANRDNSSNDGNSIVASLCLHLLVYHISEKITPPPFFDQWLAQVPRSFGNKIQLSKYMVEVATSCAKFKKYIDLDASPSEGPGVFESALSLDTQLQLWASHLPPDRSPIMRQVNPTEYPPWAAALFLSPGAPKTVEVFADPLAGSDWNMYRAVRIQLNLSMLDYLAALSRSRNTIDLTRLKSRVLENIYILSGQIACSVPHLLLIAPTGTSEHPNSTEEIRGLWGYLVMWPVSIAFSCYKNEEVEDIQSQKQWLSTVLHFLANSLGLAKAVALFNVYN